MLFYAIRTASLYSLIWLLFICICLSSQKIQRNQKRWRWLTAAAAASRAPPADLLLFPSRLDRDCVNPSSSPKLKPATLATIGDFKLHRAHSKDKSPARHGNKKERVGQSVNEICHFLHSSVRMLTQKITRGQKRIWLREKIVSKQKNERVFPYILAAEISVPQNYL